VEVLCKADFAGNGAIMVESEIHAGWQYGEC
jgi:hypothetical protein